MPLEFFGNLLSSGQHTNSDAELFLFSGFEEAERPSVAFRFPPFGLVLRDDAANFVSIYVPAKIVLQGLDYTHAY